MTKAKHRPTAPKKFELTDEYKIVDGTKVFRIRYLMDVVDVAGELVAAKDSLGGFVEYEDNLSHSSSSAILDEAAVCGKSKIWEGSVVRDTVCIYGAVTVVASDISGNTVLHRQKLVKYSVIRDGVTQIRGDNFPARFLPTGEEGRGKGAASSQSAKSGRALCNGETRCSLKEYACDRAGQGVKPCLIETVSIPLATGHAFG